jgi:hypothetical protein
MTGVNGSATCEMPHRRTRSIPIPLLVLMESGAMQYKVGTVQLDRTNYSRPYNPFGEWHAGCMGSSEVLLAFGITSPIWRIPAFRHNAHARKYGMKMGS